MLNQKKETVKDYAESIAEVATERPAAGFLSRIGRQNPATLEDSRRWAILVEQGRAQLAMSSLEQTAVLSKYEEQAAQFAPAGSLRYRAIVDAFALAGAVSISRFGK